MRINFPRFSFLPLVLSFLLVASCHAQPGKLSTSDKKSVDWFQQGLTDYLKKDYASAEKWVIKATERDPLFKEAFMLLGDIRADKKDPDGAISAYLQAYRIDPRFGAKALSYCGSIEMERTRFSEALKYFTDYLSTLNDPKEISAVREVIRRCEIGADLIKNPKPFQPINLGTGVNTPNAEYGPTLSTDGQTLIFTRLEPVVKRSCPTPDGRLEDFYSSTLDKGTWTRAENVGYPLNSDCNEGAQSISPDGNYLFFAAVGRPDGFSEKSDIYYSLKSGKGWSQPQNLGAPVNTKFWESQPFIASDGRTLYYVSNMPGGKGGADIWKSELQADGKWGRPENLGEKINTPGDEFSPFIHQDNQTLYFSSDYHPGIGGFDFFYSRRQSDGHFGPPVNLGFPINTVDDERSLVISSDGKTGYYASNKLEGSGDFDLYQFELYPEARPVPVTYMAGTVRNIQTGMPLEADFELIDLETGDIVIRSFSDSRTGAFLVAIPVNKNYALNVSKSGYLFYSENFSLKEMKSQIEPYRKDVDLIPVRADERIVMKNIFFETGSADLKSESRAELEKLLGFLNQNPSLKIEISGHTDNVGSKEANLKLSEGRAKAVVDYLLKVGIDGNRLASKGYGDSRPIDDNNTPEGRANNRRTEFKIISL
jgi:outer membrane protein OmpA-like peptidoglycan-associated protein